MYARQKRILRFGVVVWIAWYAFEIISPTFMVQNSPASEYDRKPNINAQISIIKIKRVSFLSSVSSRGGPFIMQV